MIMAKVVFSPEGRIGTGECKYKNFSLDVTWLCPIVYIKGFSTRLGSRLEKEKKYVSVKVKLKRRPIRFPN